MAGLTDKQKMFCAEYMVDLNAARSAIRAGYSPKCANRAGYKLMNNPGVKAEIDRMMRERAGNARMREEDIIRVLESILCANVTDFMTVEDGEVKVHPISRIDPDKLPALACVKNSARGAIELKQYDKVRAAELLMRHLGLLREKTDHSGKIEVTVELAGEVGDWGK